MVTLDSLRIGGAVFALVDLAFGLYILGYYSKIQYEKHHCYWAPGTRSCDFFVYETNHQTRTIVGIISGCFSVIFSLVLLFAFLQKQPLLAWSWLSKALVLVGINVYYLADWLVKRGRYYHTYWDPDEYHEETHFIIQAAVELVIQLVLSFIFCAFNGLFTFQRRGYERARKEAREVEMT